MWQLLNWVHCCVGHVIRHEIVMLRPVTQISVAGLVVACLWPAFLAPDLVVAAEPPLVITKTIARGIHYIQELDSESPLIVNVVTVDLNCPGVGLHVGIGRDYATGGSGQGREDVSSIARRYNAVAAINGDYFPGVGDPLGVGITGGQLFSEPWTGNGRPGPRTAMYVSDDGKRVHFQKVTFLGDLECSDGCRIAVNGIDRSVGSDDTIVFSPIYGTETRGGYGGCRIVVKVAAGDVKANKLVTGKVTSVVAQSTGPSPIPSDSVVIAASPGPPSDALMEHLKVGSACSFVLAVASPGEIMAAVQIAHLPRDADDLPSRSGDSISRSGYEWGTASEAVSGGPRLLYAGHVDIDATEEGFDTGFTDQRNPRTAIGTNADGSELVMVTVDGRQKLSRGVTLIQLAHILARYGATDGINLDGGGSTDMTVAGLVVSNPVGGERPIADSVLVTAANPIIPMLDGSLGSVYKVAPDAPAATTPDSTVGASISIHVDSTASPTPNHGSDSEESQEGDKLAATATEQPVAARDAVIVRSSPIVDGSRTALFIRSGDRIVPGEDPEIIWQGDSKVGFTEQNGIFNAVRPGTARVTALYQGKIYHGDIIVTGHRAEATWILHGVLVDDPRYGDPRKQQFTITTLNHDGSPRANVRVRVVSLNGTVSAGDLITNEDGYATADVAWDGQNGGELTISAQGKPSIIVHQSENSRKLP